VEIEMAYSQSLSSSNPPSSSSSFPIGGGTPFISEIDYDQASTDSKEFVELANPSGTAFDLSGTFLVLVNGNGSTIYGGPGGVNDAHPIPLSGSIPRG
jgi:hypothetical protein